MPIFHYKMPKPVFSGAYKKSDLAMPSGAVFDAPLASNASSAVTGQALTTSGNVTYSTIDGIPCAVFDGSSVITTVDNIGISGTQPVSISGWLKSYGYVTEWAYAAMIGLDSNSSMLMFGARNDLIYASGFGYDLISNINATDKFHHVVATFDGDAMAYYVDGTFQGDMYAPLNIAVNKLFIGNSSSSNHFNGAVSAVRVYDRVLSDTEIIELSKEFIPAFNTPTSSGFDDMGFAVPYDMASDAECDRSMIPKDGLLCYFSMDDTGDVAVDKVNGIELTSTGSFTNSIEGIKGTCWEATAKSSYLSGNQDTFELPQEFTLNAFMQYTSISTNTYVNAPIVDFGSWNHNTGFGLWLGKDARVTAHLDEGAGYHYGSVVLSPNVWYMVTMTYDGSRMRSYINANLDVDTSYSGSVKQDTLIATFSRGPGGGSTSECWAGKLDEVGLWNYAMTQEEIKKLARAYKMEVSE